MRSIFTKMLYSKKYLFMQPPNITKRTINGFTQSLFKIKFITPKTNNENQIDFRFFVNMLTFINRINSS